MSVVLIDLADGGARIRSVRLVTATQDDVWSPADDSAWGQSPAAAAEWVARQIDLHESPPVGSVCIDASDSRCHWLSTPSASPTIMRGAILQSRPSAWGDWSTESDVSPLDASATALEALASPERPSGAQRDAVVTIPDAAARVMIDELDAEGIIVERVGCLWHHLARAWDPGARPTVQSDVDSDLESQSPMTAVVMIEATDDGRRRVVWTWSDRGRLIAAGSARPPKGPIGAAFESLAGRLSSDWLAWGAQIGASPARIVLLVDERLDGAERGPLARAAERLAPNASVDAVSLPDPAAQTLRRIAERAARPTPDAREALQSLSNRPGRIHRSAYRWLTLGLASIALVLGVFGHRLHSSAGALKHEGEAARQAWRNDLAASMPELAIDPFPRIRLDDEISTLRQELDVLLRGRADGRPLLEELDAITFALGSENGIILLDVYMSNATGPTISLLAPDIDTAEFLDDNLSAFSENARYTGNFTERGVGRVRRYRELADHVQFDIQGRWVSGDEAQDGGSS